jgi:hypothetical protein
MLFPESSGQCTIIWCNIAVGCSIFLSLSLSLSPSLFCSLSLSRSLSLFLSLSFSVAPNLLFFGPPIYLKAARKKIILWFFLNLRTVHNTIPLSQIHAQIQLEEEIIIFDEFFVYFYHKRIIYIFFKIFPQKFLSPQKFYITELTCDAVVGPLIERITQSKCIRIK